MALFQAEEFHGPFLHSRLLREAEVPEEAARKTLRRTGTPGLRPGFEPGLFDFLCGHFLQLRLD